MNHNRCYIIAEAGVNHNGSLDSAIKLIEMAASCGADAIKFQTFNSRLLVTHFAKKTDYQIKQTQDSDYQITMLESLELNKDVYPSLIKMARKNNIDFLSTPFDLDSLSFLIELGIERIKISSGDITNGPLLLAAAQTGLPIILSTGMANCDEIQAALAVLAFGYCFPKERPNSIKDCLEILESEKMTSTLKDRITLLHCTSEYPAPFDEINLRMMNYLESYFKLNVGYSDHSLGTLVPLLAVAAGAKIIEKHITLNKNLPGPDHSASLEYEELKNMVEQVRLAEIILGTELKQPTISELKNKKNVRRGLYSAQHILASEPFSEKNMIALRPENGVSPMECWDLYAKKASRNYGLHENIESNL